MISLPEGLFYAEAEGKDKYVTTRESRLNAAMTEVRAYGRKFTFITGDEVEKILRNHNIEMDSLTPSEWNKLGLVIR